MELSDEQRHDLDVPADDGPPPADARVQLILGPVGRLAASLRNGRWDDAHAAVEEFPLDRLLEVVMSFKGPPVYGWEFVDRPEADKFATWNDRLSLDWRAGPDGMSHTLDLLQEGYDRHLDLRIWFDELRVFTPEHEEISLDDFAPGGVRWWDGLYADDPRTAGHGIAPLGNGRTGGQ